MKNVLLFIYGTIVLAVFVGGNIYFFFEAEESRLRSTAAEAKMMEFMGKGDRFVAQDGRDMVARIDRLEVRIVTLEGKAK